MTEPEALTPAEREAQLWTDWVADVKFMAARERQTPTMSPVAFIAQVMDEDTRLAELFTLETGGKTYNPDSPLALAAKAELLTLLFPPPCNTKENDTTKENSGSI